MQVTQRMVPYAPFCCEDQIQGTAVLDKITKHEQELPPASQEAAMKAVINAPETSHSMGEGSQC